MKSHTDNGQILYQGSEGQRIAIRQDSFNESGPHIIFCGGFHSNMRGSKASRLAILCRQKSWGYTRFDYRGHGASEGDADAFTLHDWLEDTLSIIDGLDRAVILVGSSMGGWIATLAALRRRDKVQGLLLLAAAPDFLQELITPGLDKTAQWDLQQSQTIMLETQHDQAYPITQSLLDSGKELTLLSDKPVFDQPELANLQCPCHLIHGNADTEVPYSLSVRLMHRMPQDEARLTLLHKANHRLSDERSLAIIEGALADMVQLCTEPA